MKKGTRFRFVGPERDFDTRRGIKIGDTGTVLQEGSPNPWCAMDTDTLPGWWQEPNEPHGGLHKCAKGYGVSVKRLVCLCADALEIIPAKPKSPRKAPKLQETSLQAHRSQKDKAPTDCMVVYNRLRKYPRGATCDRLEQALGMSHQTTSARLNDLAGRGKIVDSGRRERTRSGRPAICWKAVV